MTIYLFYALILLILQYDIRELNIRSDSWNIKWINKWINNRKYDKRILIMLYYAQIPAYQLYQDVLILTYGRNHLL
jgi:hypothetical protein